MTVFPPAKHDALGLDGLLGLDLLAGHRLEFRFRGRHRASIGHPRIEEQGFLAAERPRVRFAPPVVREPDGVAERLMIVVYRGLRMSLTTIGSKEAALFLMAPLRVLLSTHCLWIPQWVIPETA